MTQANRAGFGIVGLLIAYMESQGTHAIRGEIKISQHHDNSTGVELTRFGETCALRNCSLTCNGFERLS